jgi:hypothetical protein
MNILFYGNCQIGSLIPFIKFYLANYKVVNILCWQGTIEKEYFLNNIQTADIIITQPISPNYRDTDYLDTEFILNNSKKSTKVIILPSLYFNFYYFDLTYKFLDGNILHEPSDYHYNKIIECYKKKLDKHFFIENYVNNSEYKSVKELETIASESINELSRREKLMEEYNKIRPVIIIKGSEYIRENYKKQLLFYSMNHPTKYLMQYICKKILNELLNVSDEKFINLDLVVDPLFLNERGILYKCIQNVVKFNINDYTPQLSKFKANNIEQIVSIYYDTYDKIDITKL